MGTKYIFFGSDHGGFELKESLKQALSNREDVCIEDLGTHSSESVDYPDIANAVAHAILDKEGALGVLCCGTGVGISMRANRFKGIRAALVHSVETAQLAKQHNNANILCLGGRTTTDDDAREYVEAWLNSEFEGDRHERRVQKLDS